MFGLNRIDTCPACGWDIKLTRGVVVSEESLNAGMAALGAIGFGIEGAIIGAALGKRKKTTMYVCSNMMCKAIYDPWEFKAWKKEAQERGEL